MLHAVKRCSRQYITTYNIGVALFGHSTSVADIACNGTFCRYFVFISHFKLILVESTQIGVLGRCNTINLLMK